MNGGKPAEKIKQNKMSARKLAIAFSIFILLIIITADLGYLRFVFCFIHQFENLDKVLHFLLIGILTYLVSAGLIESFPNMKLKLIVYRTIIFMLVFFTIEELSQLTIRGRSFSLIDLGANYLGILVFGFLAWRKYSRTKKETDS